MIRPEIDLELSIKALEVYGIEPNIIKSMLSNLQKVVNKNCNIPNVSGSFCNCSTLKKELHYSYNVPVCFKCNRVVKLQNDR